MDLLVEPGPQEEHRQAHHANQHRFGVDGADVLRESLNLVGGFNSGRASGVCEPHQVFQLSDDDGYGDAGSKPGGDGVGNETDKRAELQYAHQNQHDACDDGGGEQAVKAIGGDDAGNDGGKRCGRAGNLNAAAAQKGDKEARDDGGVQACFGAYAGSDGKGDGKRQGHHGNHDAGYDVFRELLFEFFFAGVLDDAEQNRLDLVVLHDVLFVLLNVRSFLL